jgi:hypothetical protein
MRQMDIQQYQTQLKPDKAKVDVNIEEKARLY